jgi:prophage DNA circulation protein
MSRARFRDFEFLTDSHDAKAGRRLVVHEYPGADVPLVEDLGEKAWDWSLDAYFIGPDYDLARNEFMMLISEPGADWLTHPWLGQLWVRVSEWSVSESTEKGGYCTVKVSFVPGGEIRQPELDLCDAAQAATVALADVAVEEFEPPPMPSNTLQMYVAAVQQRLEGLRKIISLATLPLTWAAQIMNVVNGIKTDLSALAAMPGAYAAALRGLANALGLRDGSRRDASADLRPGARAALVGRIVKAATNTTANTTPDATLLANLRAERDLRQRLVVSAALSVAIADYSSADERDRALDAVERAVTALLPGASDAVFQAAAQARAAVITALVSQDLRSEKTRNIVAPLPAVLIAHHLGVSEEVFLARNAVRHPLFVNGEVRG